MEKDLLVFFGSPHESGYTAKFLNHFLKFFSGFNVNMVKAYEENIKPCIGCENCKIGSICIFRDMDRINILLKKSSGIVIAAPIYNASFPSPLKSIFDRMQVYYFFRRALKSTYLNKKKAVILLTQGSEKADYEKIINVQINPVIKLMGADLIDTLTLKGTDNKNLDIDKFYIKSENKIRNIISNFDSI